jgi:hypothetical protein
VGARHHVGYHADTGGPNTEKHQFLYLFPVLKLVFF